MRLAIVALAVLIAGPGRATPPRLISTEAGKDAPVGIYAVVRRDCSIGASPEIHITRAPAHGTVLVEDVQVAARRAESCTPVVGPGRRVIYRPMAGFSGQDDLLFEIVDRDTGQTVSHPVMIIVQPAPAAI